jgi:hypothetical protein
MLKNRISAQNSRDKAKKEKEAMVAQINDLET